VAAGAPPRPSGQRRRLVPGGHCAVGAADLPGVTSRGHRTQLPGRRGARRVRPASHLGSAAAGLRDPATVRRDHRRASRRAVGLAAPVGPVRRLVGPRRLRRRGRRPAPGPAQRGKRRPRRCRTCRFRGQRRSPLPTRGTRTARGVGSAADKPILGNQRAGLKPQWARGTVTASDPRQDHRSRGQDGLRSPRTTSVGDLRTSQSVSGGCRGRRSAKVAVCGQRMWR
jgi:hypothetical protein